MLLFPELCLQRLGHSEHLDVVEFFNQVILIYLNESLLRA